MISVWLVGKGTQYYRIGVQLDAEDDEHQQRVSSYLNKYFKQRVEFVDNFAMPISSDIDYYVGVGDRKIDGGTIVTCKSLFWLTTKHDDNNQWEWLKEWHEGLREAVEAAYEKKQARKKETNCIGNGDCNVAQNS